MRRPLFAALLASSLFACAPLSTVPNARAGADITPDCTLKGHKLYGNIQVVDSFPDLRVQVVTSFPDLRVRKMQSFADSCGEWRMVDTFADLRIQFVTSFPDLQIEYVDSFPGMR
ncbi:MAG: hypothetical protein AAFV53_27175 [Myxococcota bacterium]